ncbi:TPA: hypothetical protein HA219_02760 [Candidatus Woesearchaeota archaeon]|nr:hypothetical protein [Candidatus Woesearchaeota archaeon]
MLLKTWFSLVSVILVSTLAVLLYNFNFTLLYWISLLVLIIAISMQFIIYLEKTNNKNHDMQKTYSDFLKRKDRQIEELQLKNNLMFKTAMKKSQADIELAELKRKWEEKMKEDTV